MKKLLCVTALLLSACGYSSVYKQTASQMQDVYVEKVSVAIEQRLPGERRVAQLVNQRLLPILNGEQGAPYVLTLTINEDRRTLAVLRDATEDRFEIELSAVLNLKDINGDVIFNKELTSSAPYNVETSPYSTDSGKDRARKSAANSLSEEVIQSVNFFLYSQNQ